MSLFMARSAEGSDGHSGGGWGYSKEDEDEELREWRCQGLCCAEAVGKVDDASNLDMLGGNGSNSVPVEVVHLVSWCDDHMFLSQRGLTCMPKHPKLNTGVEMGMSLTRERWLS
jgi:hypothetical protein